MTVRQAVVLVGGQGTRMRPLTDTIPKPLIPFMNRPFLHHVLDHLARHGVEEAILSSPYLEERFRGFLEERVTPPRVTWITEERPLGTSGAVAGAADLLTGTFLVLNGDVLTDLDLGALVRFHRDRDAIGTIALTPVEDARPYGLVDMGSDGRVLAFREKPADAIPGSINAGTYVLEPEALADVPRGVMVSIERETFPSLIDARAPLFAMLASGYWRDLGTPAAYLDGHRDAFAGRVRLAAPGPDVDPSAEIAPDALVEGTAVAAGSRVAAGAVVRGSVLLAGCVVGAGARVESSVLGPGARVGQRATVRGSVLGADASVAPEAHAEDQRLPGPASEPAR